MKASELMYSDWIRRHWTCTDTGREVVRDFQITEIRKNGKNTLAWSKDGNMGRVDQLEPIPLTPKILEKNGFIYEKLKGVGDNEIWRIEDDYYDINIYEWSDSIWIFRYDCNEMSLPHTQVTMSYVHELQHALSLCGVNKEIEL